MLRLLAAATLVAVALSPTAPAQAPPGLTVPPAPSTVFDIASPTFKSMGSLFSIGQVSFRKLSNDAPGDYTTCLTLDPPSSTGPRTWDVAIGSFDLKTRVFTPTTLAAALNSDDHDYGLSLEPGLGRYAVFDRISLSAQPLGVFFSHRASASQPFAAPVRVSGLQGTGLYAYPALGYVGGRLRLFYAALLGGQQGIYMSELDVSDPMTPKVAGTPELVVRPVAGGAVHSPFPMVGPDGDVEGLMHGETAAGGADSDPYLSNDLDPATPQVRMIDSAGWMAGGSFAGGYLAAADDANSTPAGPWARTTDAEGAWLCGDVEPLGGTLDVFGGATDLGGGGQVLTFVVVDFTLQAVPIPIPSIHGVYALGVNPLTLLPAMVHDQDGIGTLSLRVPNNTKLRGRRFPIQGLAFQPSTGAATFTNSAWLKIR